MIPNNELKNNIEKLIKIVQNQGLDEGRNFYDTHLYTSIEQVKKNYPDFYENNYEYFTEIFEMLYVHPNFNQPIRTTKDSIDLISEFFKKTE